jgi:tyrosyl-tRNA synthetase
MESKKSLAERLVSRYHSLSAAQEARAEFELRFSKRDFSTLKLPCYSLEQPQDIVTLGIVLFQTCFGITKSRGEIRRLLEGGSVTWSGEKIVDVKKVIQPGHLGVLKLDRKHAVTIS